MRRVYTPFSPADYSKNDRRIQTL